ncbi:MAG: NAD-dependent epimerase/dehydratase family protein [Lachnospiraceae bacterium]|nr:NAD-dependent epimerase/dehydratase family protein [Lachnospiraceae bacterium]
MKVLLIGGTGVISKAISRRLLEEGHELWMINRGKRLEGIPKGAHLLCADINYEEEKVTQMLGDQTFDVVADFIAFVPQQLERDHRLFAKRTKQFIYISSASAYQKPASDFRINEGTPLANPYWQYSRNKISGEELMMRYYREEGFPVTIVRPSHTYNEEKVPVCVHGPKGSWQVVKRMIEEKAVIIPGDGSSLWTLTWNDDFAKGFIGLMGNAHAIGEAVQITSDEVLTWNQIYQVIADALGVELKPYYVASEFLASCSPKEWDLRGNLWGDKSNTVFFDNTKLKRLVPDFKAVVRFDQGVRRSLEYILSHPEYQIPDPEFDAWCDRVIEVQEEALAKMR